MKLLISTKQFSFRFSPKAVTPPVASRYLRAAANPLRPKIQHLYDNRDPNTLWWRVSTQDLQDYKRVVRSWCARRARLAFRRELKSRGFDAEGRRLASDVSPGSVTADGLGDRLRGSATIMIRSACIQAKYSEVESEMKTLIDVLLQQQQEQQLQLQKQFERDQRRRAREESKTDENQTESPDLTRSKVEK